MKIVNCVLTFFLLLSLAIIVSSCKEDGKKNEAVSFLLDRKPDSWLLSERIDSFLNRQKISPSIVKNGLSRETYLKIIEGQVRAFQKYQNDSGRIIDPVARKEMYFTTPCYAHSIAVLAASGFTKDKVLIESGMRAMDVVTSDMARNWSAGRHGDFYTWPVMFAFKQYKGIADKERYADWGKNIEKMNPEFFYNTYLKFGNNWNIVNTAGEFLRYKAGYTSLNYVDTCLKSQLPHFTDYGMYNENGNPFPYDLFSRHYISGMLALGYHGRNFEKYSEIVTKGAWMSMFLQSPFGELPTGFRSSHHIWNEAEQCVVFEIFASEYSKNGEHAKAGAFKRAAMLSLESINSWIRPDGSGYIVKNKYPMDARYGYEVYSVHTCYNMLATSMLAQAWQFSTDTIEEKPSPADLGGYVLPIIEPFHKIFASVGQTYLEYDTRGDQLYNPTGILRIHIMGSHPQLGPSDGCAEKYSGKGISIAAGPSWQNSDGTWSSLAESKPENPVVEILSESNKLAQFKVTFSVRDKNDRQIIIIENISVARGKVTVEDEIIGNVTNMRLSWPVLIFNGESQTDIKLGKTSAVLELEGKKIKFQLLYPGNSSLKMSGNQYVHRNGISEPLVAALKGNKATYCISMAE